MKVVATCSPFEALPPAIWQSFKRQIIEAGKDWGLQVEVSQDLTVSDAEARYWDMLNNARLATKTG